MLLGLSIRDLRGYAELDAVFRPGPQLVWGSNAAGKTSLLEAIVLAAWGRSHRTAADGELVRWGQELARVEARVGEPDAEFGPRDVVEVALVRSAAGGARKRIRVNGVARRAASLVGVLRTVMFAPEEMLLVAGSPSLRREALDRLAGQRSPAYLRDLATYGRALQQRNGLLRLIREEQATRAELRFWDGTLLEAGSAVRAERHRLLEALAGPLAAAHAEIAPDEAAAGRLELTYSTNAPQLPGESVRDALARRLARRPRRRSGTAPPDRAASRRPRVRDGRAPAGVVRLAGSAADRDPAFKLAELDLLTALDGRPPLLLLDDVFSSWTRSAARTSSAGSRRCRRRS
jgi:DNA replication and repair protein RecF